MTVLRLTRGKLAQGLELDEGDRYTVILVREVEFVRLLGLFFDTNKDFLLPGTLDSLTLITKQLAKHPEGKLVIFGHTDTTGEPSLNDPLSERRAKMVQAYLEEDVDAWLAQYESGVPETRRWGSHEDFLMLSRAKGFASRPAKQNPVEWFQESRSLKVDGIAGPQTRRKLIEEYMGVEGTTVPPGTSITCVGCGEDFPLADSGVTIDAQPKDDHEDPLDRRVEIFCCDALAEDLPAATRDAYPQWLQRATNLEEENAGGAIRTLRLRLLRRGKPLSGMFTLEGPRGVLAAAELDSRGMLSAIIPAGVGEVTVDVPAAGFRRVIKVRPAGEFPAPDTIEGAQIRLFQLGFYHGELDGESGEVMLDAIRAFRRAQALPDGDDLNAGVAEALRLAYGS
jgi:outer membrane protein OmpA-like peptidoglycan-associated protein